MPLTHDAAMLARSWES